TQGGDWGFGVTRAMASIYGGKHVKAWHTNSPKMPTPTKYDKGDLERLERSNWFQTKGYGYFLEQSTQPQTIGYSLADSPVGLLAWIYEKMVVWTDAYPWDDDEGPAASLRIYYEVVGS
ncbi:hypothetical protein MPER_02546, partial [Moniliophthora perniciosa FA553]